MNAVIIDDELNATDFIKSLLKNYFPEFSILGVAHSGKEAITLIKETQPNLVFLDVEMPEGNGFKVLEQFPNPSFKVIFTTAYNHYAINAIKFSAADYLLKPINVDDFKKAVEKVKTLISTKNQPNESYSILLENIQSLVPAKLAIPTTEGMEYLNTNDIIRIEADRAYCMFYVKNRKILVSKCLGEYQELLQDRGFFRTHNSHLINTDYVIKYVKGERSHVILQDGAKIPVSRAKKEIFQKIMNERSINKM